MAKVKIFLGKGESLEKVESDLFKAMGIHASGAVHDHEYFQDPAMRDVAERLEEFHKIIYKQMLSEIFEALESEYRSERGNR